MTAETVNGRTRRAVAVLCGVQFVDVLGVTVVITALPRMLADLDATAVQGTVVVTAYAMTFGGLLMVASQVGDRVGHRRIVLASSALFGVAATIGAMASSVWLLAASRALQGLAAAASVPAALRLLTTLTPAGAPRRRAVAGWSAAGAAAGASGFVVGGVLTELTSWRSVFVAFVVLAGLLTVGISRSVPRDDDPRSNHVDIAWLPGILLTGSTMGIVAGATLLGTPSAKAYGEIMTAGGVAAATVFVVAERRATKPLVAAEAWSSRALRWGAFGAFANTATTSGSFTAAMLYLQGELGLGPLPAAGLLIGFSLMVVAGSAVAPHLISTAGWGRALAGGLGTIGVGNAMLVAWPGAAGVAVAAATSGLGIGIGSVAATDMGTNIVQALRATAAGLLNTAAQLGTALGTALVLLVATAVGTSTAWALTGGFAVASALAAARFSPRSAPNPADAPHRDARGGA